MEDIKRVISFDSVEEFWGYESVMVEERKRRETRALTDLTATRSLMRDCNLNKVRKVLVQNWQL